MLPKRRRLTRGRDFKTVFSGGRTYVHKLIVLKVLPKRRDQVSRFGFVTSSQLGKAVLRNRAKRLLREAVRLLSDKIEPKGYDAVLVARPPMREVGVAEVSRAVEKLFERAGLIRERTE